MEAMATWFLLEKGIFSNSWLLGCFDARFTSWFEGSVNIPAVKYGCYWILFQCVYVVRMSALIQLALVQKQLTF